MLIRSNLPGCSRLIYERSFSTLSTRTTMFLDPIYVKSVVIGLYCMPFTLPRSSPALWVPFLMFFVTTIISSLPLLVSSSAETMTSGNVSVTCLSLMSRKLSDRLDFDMPWAYRLISHITDTIMTILGNRLAVEYKALILCILSLLLFYVIIPVVIIKNLS